MYSWDLMGSEMGGKYASHGKIDENWVHRFPSFASPLFYSRNLRLDLCVLLDFYLYDRPVRRQGGHDMPWPTGCPQALNLTEPCATALMTFSKWTEEGWPWRMMRGRSRLGSTTGLSVACHWSKSVLTSHHMSSYVLASFRRSIRKTSPSRWRMVPPPVQRDGHRASISRNHAPHGSARLRLCDWWPRQSSAKISVSANISKGFSRFSSPFSSPQAWRHWTGQRDTNSSHKHAPNLTQDLAPQPLLPLNPKRAVSLLACFFKAIGLEMAFDSKTQRQSQSLWLSKNRPPGLRRSSKEGKVPNKKDQKRKR